MLMIPNHVICYLMLLLLLPGSACTQRAPGCCSRSGAGACQSFPIPLTNTGIHLLPKNSNITAHVAVLWYFNTCCVYLTSNCLLVSWCCCVASMGGKPMLYSFCAAPSQPQSLWLDHGGSTMSIWFFVGSRKACSSWRSVKLVLWVYLHTTI